MITLACLVAETLLTFMFLMIILGSTDARAPKGLAPLAIGFSLTLIHLISIPVTNTSVNPARSTGAPLFVGGWAIQQLWLFWLAPIVGAALAGLAYSFFTGTSETEPKTEPAVEAKARAAINGKGPFVFAIDTGAQGLARVDTSLAESLNLQSTGKVRASDGSRSVTIVLDVVHIDSGNTIGGFVLPAVLVEKLKLASPAITVGRARTVTSEVEIKEARLNESIKPGRFEFTQPTITFPALSDEANIG